ncbi:hypothetical protein NV379_14320 [Paenibacillus sp. N1-5-1-14]|uniref:tetratricopeptide repeat protein n=1 Tax=Paenibacillus radicibacter TaxID=2972488 RepID=UPI0021593FDF|nr:hypothetical protein [Paenibacillus radicibacter]MCR8643827.1 hypothetical protein [Paenibacillus radicibacter]
MAKFAIFGLLWYLLGNPFLAIIVLLILVYVLDRSFFGFMPSILKPLKASSRIRKLRDELRSNPHYTSGKIELARLLIGKKKYEEARQLLVESKGRMEDSADIHADLGLCLIKLGSLQEGEAMITRAFELNPRVQYGEPYLRLAEAYADTDAQKAKQFLDLFRDMNSSSCEAYYVLGQLYKQMGQEEKAKQAFREVSMLYRGLPKYSKRQQRKWVILAKMKG